MPKQAPAKTAAFTIPILQLMHMQQEASKVLIIKSSALILTPTRELAIQIGESIQAYGHYLSLRHQVILVVYRNTARYRISAGE